MIPNELIGCLVVVLSAVLHWIFFNKIASKHELIQITALKRQDAGDTRREVIWVKRKAIANQLGWISGAFLFLGVLISLTTREIDTGFMAGAISAVILAVAFSILPFENLIKKRRMS